MRIGGVLYLIEDQEETEDRFALVDSFINSQKAKDNGFNTTQCLKIFGLSRSGYYAWKERMDDAGGVRAQKEAETNDLKEKMRQIVIRRSGIIPGKRTFRDELFRNYGLTVNVKRISRLMKEMSLVATKPHKDAYKHQASHNHICAAPENKVCQEFFIGPRKVILTDITYLYYGVSRITFYLCIFRDAFTKENLGWSIRTDMSTSLVREAYEDMLKKHSDSFRQSSVYIHHDQGSQYLSTSFQQLLNDGGFIQSVSARGNSQDNSPMESFFGHLKRDILDLVARCSDFSTAKRVIDGYISDYNEKFYQYSLAGLTPHEFYLYATTGIYPLDSYFGVSAKEMMGIEKVVEIRKEFADEEAAKRKAAAAKKREERRLLEPKRIMDRDRAILLGKIEEWMHAAKTASMQVEHLRSILSKVEAAIGFYFSAARDIKEELKDPLKWRKYPELSYVFEMNELF